MPTRYLSPKFQIEAIPGFFMQSEPSTDPANFDYSAHNFGLIHRQYPTDQTTVAGVSTDWQRFMRYVRHLQSTAGDHIAYKLLYLGRHGEGYHNVAEAFYGTQAWDEHWSKLDGNGTITWLDAHLTPTGADQARAAATFLSAQMSHAQMMSAPDRYYVSPLHRCLQTARLAWGRLALPQDRPFTPLVKELAREVLGEHTCDKRGSKTGIREAFPDFVIEDGFSEEDELWRAEHRETHEEHDARTRALFDDLFDGHSNGDGDGDGDEGRGVVVLSVTSHSGTIASMLRVFGHREFTLPTGGMIPVLVKVTRVG